MKRITIFAVVFLVACDTINPVCHNSVTVSPASPVQFWPVDCQTFNEKEVCGIYHRCYCQPWQCDDQIKIQFTDEDFTKDYRLRVRSELGAIIDTFDFGKTVLYRTVETDLSFFNNSFEVSIFGWDQIGSGSFGTGQLFTWNNPSSARSDGQAANLSETAAIGQDREDANRPWPPGDYTVTIRATNSSVGGMAPLTQQLAVYASDIISSEGSSVSYTGTGTWDVGAGTIERTIEFTLASEKEFIWFEFFKSGPSSGYEVVFTIDSITLDEFPPTEEVTDSGVWDYTLELTDYCDEKISLEIIDSEDNIILRSDCLEVKEEHACTNLIEYSNNRNFAGLVYTDVSPAPSFTIRVKSIFFHEEYPQEDFVMELTSGIEKTSGVVTAQRKFSVDRVPYYMHKKLILVFEHQNILIDDVYWTKQEKYEMIDNQKETTPMKKGEVLLTMRDFVQRSVL